MPAFVGISLTKRGRKSTTTITRRRGARGDDYDHDEVLVPVSSSNSSSSSSLSMTKQSLVLLDNEQQQQEEELVYEEPVVPSDGDAAVVAATSSSSSSYTSSSSGRGIPPPRGAQQQQQQQTPQSILPSTVILKRTKQSKSIRYGNQLIFANSILRILDDDDNNDINKIDDNDLLEGNQKGEQRDDQRRRRRRDGAVGGSCSSSSSLNVGDLVRVVVQRAEERGREKARQRDGSGTKRRSSVSESESVESTVLAKNNKKKKTAACGGVDEIGWGIYNPYSLYRVRMLCHKSIQPDLCERIEKQIQQQQQQTSMSTLSSTLSTLSTSSAVLDSNDVAAASTTILKEILFTQIRIALQKRTMLNLVAHHDDQDNSDAQVTTYTDTYRLLNGEGDNLSALVMDIIGGHVIVIMSSAYWCEIHKHTILSVVDKIFNGNENNEGNTTPNKSKKKQEYRFVWKTTSSRLKQDGYNKTSTSHKHDPSNSIAEESSSIDDDTMVLTKENGIRFCTYPFMDGQKTGVYCDQRENRLYIANLAQNKTILDLCCYHGGFSFTSLLKGNARQVVGVDSSQDAIDICWKNAKLNNISNMDNGSVQFVRDDITKFMQNLYYNNNYDTTTTSLSSSSDETNDVENDNDDVDNNIQSNAIHHDIPQYYDIVILDPPKLAPTLASLQRASRKYHSYNRDAIRLIDPNKGGLLLTCTCSSAMTNMQGGQYFINVVHNAAIAAGRGGITLLRMSGPANCHTRSPAVTTTVASSASGSSSSTSGSIASGSYLTAALFHVQPLVAKEEGETITINNKDDRNKK